MCCARTSGIFAIAADEPAARRCAEAMRAAFGTIDSALHVGAIAQQGVRAVR